MYPLLLLLPITFFYFNLSICGEVTTFFLWYSQNMLTNALRANASMFSTFIWERKFLFTDSLKFLFTENKCPVLFWYKKKWPKKHGDLFFVTRYYVNVHHCCVLCLGASLKVLCRIITIVHRQLRRIWNYPIPYNRMKWKSGVAAPLIIDQMLGYITVGNFFHCEW